MIDIVMPFYGDAELLRAAVRSVMGQSDDRWRLVVLDDRYPDPEPGAWVAGIDDPRVEYVRNETNLGVAGNFRRSVAIATAPHLTIMGCDDLMHKGYVARLHELIAEYPDAAYFQPGVEVIDEQGAVVRPLVDRVKGWYAPAVGAPLQLSGADLMRSLARGNWTYFPSICWRTDVVAAHDFDPSLEVALDLDLQFRIVQDGGSLVVDPVPVFQYRRHHASVSALTANDGTRFVEERRVLREAADVAADRGWTRAARAARWRVSSRLSALSRVPATALARDGSGVRSLVSHAVTLDGRARSHAG